MDCKEYSSKWITASELMTPMACELVCLVVLSSNNTSDLQVYNGESANGELKLRLRQGASVSRPYHFNPHVYLGRGLYLQLVQKVDGVFVQWRNRPSKEG